MNDAHQILLQVDFSRAEKLATRLGVSLYEVSAKTARGMFESPINAQMLSYCRVRDALYIKVRINCDDAFHTLAAAMREKVTASSMHSDESDEHEEFSSAFHVDGVLGNNRKSSVRSTCCSSAPEPTFV
ncbi:hypothetical protein Y032_0142g2309 [Ancylostoma ceylanicum]|uniref:Uncharacterized protein n=1 Tax=Ancylostoma ceylanicum TaxID=53326 RepID=A0A016T3R3_9BILA|nr:hypothetical protein Y032_0142g2309 [Ancylostoma ceylanicum]